MKSPIPLRTPFFQLGADGKPSNIVSWQWVKWLQELTGLSGSDLINGEFVKSQSITTGSVPASSSASVTLTWTTPFSDAVYLAYPSLLEATAGVNTLRVHHIESVSTTQVVVTVYNDDAGGAHTGTLNVLGIHG